MESHDRTLPGDTSLTDIADAAETQRLSERDRFVWAQFAQADNAESFCRSWLAIQCRIVTDVIGGLMLLGPPDTGPFTPIAVWPDMRRSMEYLTGAAERALKERRGLLLGDRVQPEPGDPGVATHHIAYPIEVDEKLHGVVVLDVASRPEPQLQTILRQLHWGSAWLEVLFRRQESQ